MSWTTVKLADLATVSSGGGAPQDADAFSAEGIPFVRAGSLIKLLKGVPEHGLELLQPEVAAANRLKLFPSGTVLFAKSGMSATKGHIYQLKNPAYVVNHLAALTPRSEIAGRYLRHVLRFKSPTCLIKDEAYPSIRLGEIEEMEVPAPKGDVEKERIAGILDRVDELRRKRQRAVDRIDQLGQAVFHEMFVDGRSDWPERPLAEIVTPGTIVTYGIVQAGEEYEGGVPYIRTGDIKDGHIATEGLRHTNPAIATKFERSRVRAGEIVMSIRATVGTVAFVPDELDGANLTQGTARISPGPEIEPWYLIEYLRSPATQSWIDKQVKGATFREITLTRLRELVVVLPSESLQKRFSEIMNRIQHQRALAVDALRKTEAVFSSLQNRAFRGEL